MVIGGWRSATVELASLDPVSNPVPPCLADLNDFPTEIYDAAGSIGEGRVRRQRLI